MNPPPKVSVNNPAPQTFIVIALDDYAARILQELAETRPRNITLAPIGPQRKRSRGMLLRYPLDYDFDAV